MRAGTVRLICLAFPVCLAACGAAKADHATLRQAIVFPPAYQVNSLDVSPDGKTIASVWSSLASGGSLYLDDRGGGKRVTISDEASVAAFSPTGRLLAYTHFGETGEVVSLYDVKLRQHLRSVILPIGDYPGCVAFSADGSLLACGTSAGAGKPCAVWLYRTATLALKSTLVGNIPRPYSIAFSKDGRYLAASGYVADTGLGGTAVWSLRDRRLRQGSSEDGQVVFAPDQHTLICGDKTMDVRATGARFQAFTETVFGLRLIGKTANDTFLFCHLNAHGNARGPLETWSFSPRKRLRRWYGESFAGSTHQYALSWDGHTLADAFPEKGRWVVKLWRVS